MPLNSCDDNRTTSAFTSKLTPAADVGVGLTILSIGMLIYLLSPFLPENKSTAAWN